MKRILFLLNTQSREPRRHLRHSIRIIVRHFDVEARKAFAAARRQARLDTDFLAGDEVQVCVGVDAHGAFGHGERGAEVCAWGWQRDAEGRVLFWVWGEGFGVEDGEVLDVFEAVAVGGDGACGEVFVEGEVGGGW